MSTPLFELGAEGTGSVADTPESLLRKWLVYATVGLSLKDLSNLRKHTAEMILKMEKERKASHGNATP